jgi:hypothetical protein
MRATAVWAKEYGWKKITKRITKVKARDLPVNFCCCSAVVL